MSLLSFLHKAEEDSAGLPALMSVAEKAATGILSGEHNQHKTGSGEKFWQFREYESGDRPQDIDWRQSAKSDHVYIRQREWQTTQKALFWRQDSPGMDYTSAGTLPTKKDSGTTMALALALLMARAGEQVGPLNGSIRPGRTELAIERMGEHLLSDHAGELPGAQTFKIPHNAGAVLIGDFLAPMERIEQSCATIAPHTGNVLMIQILDPAELTLPFSGRVIFENENGDENHHITNVESIRTAYGRRINEHLESVKHLCRKQQWHWFLHRTDEPLRESLFKIWSMVSLGISSENFHGRRHT